MSKHTVIGLAGKRLEIKPSPTSPGCVLVQVITAGREVVASVTLDAHGASVAGFALNHESVAVDAAMQGQGVAA